jgi:hypothetical protein
VTREGGGTCVQRQREASWTFLLAATRLGAVGLACDLRSAVPRSCRLVVEFIPLPAKTIADTSYGLQHLGVGWIFFDFLAQPADMDIDGACISHIIVVPDMM